MLNHPNKNGFNLFEPGITLPLRITIEKSNYSESCLLSLINSLMHCANLELSQEIFFRYLREVERTFQRSPRDLPMAGNDCGDRPASRRSLQFRVRSFLRHESETKGAFKHAFDLIARKKREPRHTQVRAERSGTFDGSTGQARPEACPLCRARPPRADLRAPIPPSRLAIRHQAPRNARRNKDPHG